jgi:hypothetical protein
MRLPGFTRVDVRAVQTVPYSRLAHLSQIFGNLSWPTSPFCIGALLAIAAIATSVMARNRLHPEDRVGAYMATLGMYFGCWCFGIIASLIVGAAGLVALRPHAAPLFSGLWLIFEGALLITLMAVTWPRRDF